MDLVILVLYLTLCPILPLLPGTRTMYNTNGSRTLCVGFRGYCGGLANNVVNEDRERASTGAVMDGGTAEGQSEVSKESVQIW